MDSKIALERPLKVFCHSVGFISKGNFFNTQKEMISKFKDWGLPVSDEIYFCENLDKVNRQILKMTAKREKLNYEINVHIVEETSYTFVSILFKIQKVCTALAMQN